MSSLPARGTYTFLPHHLCMDGHSIRRAVVAVQPVGAPHLGTPPRSSITGAIKTEPPFRFQVG